MLYVQLPALKVIVLFLIKVGKTALHYAADKNLIESVQILIENGCEKNLQDNVGIH